MPKTKYCPLCGGKWAAHDLENINAAIFSISFNPQVCSECAQQLLMIFMNTTQELISAFREKGWAEKMLKKMQTDIKELEKATLPDPKEVVDKFLKRCENDNRSS